MVLLNDVLLVALIMVQRKDIPPSVTNANQTIDTSSWGTPSASFTNCNVTEYFGPQQIVFDITFCGQEYVRVSHCLSAV